MNNYCANVVDDSVVEIIVSDYEWAINNLPGQWHDLGGDPLAVAIGYLYDSVTNTFVEPKPQPLPVTDETE